MQLIPIAYEHLEPRQQENDNFAKVSAVLADYGFMTRRLTDDWRGADFIGSRPYRRVISPGEDAESAFSQMVPAGNSIGESRSGSLMASVSATTDNVATTRNDAHWRQRDSNLQVCAAATIRV